MEQLGTRKGSSTASTSGKVYVIYFWEREIRAGFICLASLRINFLSEDFVYVIFLGCVLLIVFIISVLSLLLYLSD